MVRTALEFTQVVYDSDKLFGWSLAMIALWPQFVMSALVGVLLSRREIQAIALCIGLIISDRISVMLKAFALRTPQLVKLAQRPPLAELSDGGLPSSHAQFCGFFAAYVVALILAKKISWRRTAIFLAVLQLVLVTLSRIILLYHTLLQVTVGAVVGGLLGAVWYIIFQSIAPSPRHPLCQKFLLKDSLSTSYNMLVEEYELAAGPSAGKNAKIR